MIEAARYCLGLFLICLIMLGIIFCIVPPADAGDCHVLHQQQFVHGYYYAQPFVQNVFYRVGEPIQFEALVQKAVQAELQKLKQPQEMPAEAPARATDATFIAEHCAECHSLPKPAKGLVIDGNAPLDANLLRRCLLAIEKGSMPKGKKLTPEEKAGLFSELLIQSQPQEESSP
jgi:hypothetical protein